MALLLLDSFSTYATADLARRWMVSTNPTGPTTTLTVEPTAGRNGRPCLKRVIASGNSQWSTTVTVSPVASQGGAWAGAAGGVIGFAFYLSGSLVGAVGYFLQVQAGAFLLQFVVADNGSIVVQNSYYGSPQTIGTSAAAIPKDEWCYVEIKWVSATSIAIKVNGSTVFTYGNWGSGNWTAIALLNEAPAWYAACDMRIADLYLCDTSGSLNNDFLGDVTVRAIRPSGAGNTTGWTPNTGANYAAVDDATPDDDTTYISATAAATKDTYAFENVPSGAVPKGLQVAMLARKDGDGSVALKSVVRHGTTDYDAAAAQGIAAVTYSYVVFPYDTNPGTSAAFSESDINGAEFGIVKGA